LTGDVMYDCALKFASIAEKYCDPFAKFAVKNGQYILMTCHRAENTDDESRLAEIVKAVNKLSEQTPVLYPVHPRTSGFLEKYGLSFSAGVKTVPPVGYLEMLLLEKGAELILTDSGGVQKEAFFYAVPCVTMRDETEWVETVELGWNILTGASSAKITENAAKFAENPPTKPDKSPYGDGDAAGKITETLLSF